MARRVEGALDRIASWRPWRATVRSARRRAPALGLIASCLRVAWLRLTQPGVRVGFDSYIGPRCTVRCAEGATIVLENTKLSSDVTVDADAGAHLRIAARFVGPGCIFAAKRRIDLGRGCQVADMVTIRDHDHVHDEATPLDRLAFRTAPVEVRDNVWLGSKVTVVAGVTIGEHALAAAGAVVTSDVAPGARVGGVPARPLG